jgi:hypothetical protein
MNGMRGRRTHLLRSLRVPLVKSFVNGSPPREGLREGSEGYRSPPRTSIGGTGGAGNASAAMVETLTQALSGLLPQLQGVNAIDLVQLGLGLGLSLQGVQSNPGLMGQTGGLATGGHVMGGQTMGQVMGQTVSFADTARPGPIHGAHPIGIVDATQSGRNASLLDHSAETSQRDNLAQTDAKLSTAEQYKGMQVVSAPPDERTEGHVMHVSRETEARRQVPVFAYPPDLLGKDYSTHAIAGAGVSFVPAGQGAAQVFVAESKVTPFCRAHTLPYSEIVSGVRVSVCCGAPAMCFRKASSTLSTARTWARLRWTTFRRCRT